MKPGLYINGEWEEGAGAEIATIDPATEKEVWSVRAADADDVARATAAAHDAYPAWAATPLSDRIAVLEAYGAQLKQDAEAISDVISRETGKPKWDADAEIQAMIGKIAISISAYGERTGARAAPMPFGAMHLAHRPHGVMAVLGPYNFPGHLPNGHIVPALLAGNTVVFKSSELTLATGISLALALANAGLPPGVFNLVTGGRDVGEALIAQDDLAGVLFTGSAHTGAAIHRHFAGRPDIILALEMGGNNPLIVWPPADIEAAAALIAHSAFITSGQRCSCARRLIVPAGEAGDAIIDALAAFSDRLIVGAYTEDPKPFMGPLVSRCAADAARAFEAELIANGAVSVRALGGKGAFVRPAILTLDDPDMAPDEECFAPLLQVLRARNFDDAVTIANATRFGLAAGLISDDADLWAQAQTRLRAGILNWNRPTTGASSMLPFGGPGASGSGRPSAYYAADYCAYPVASQTAERAQTIATLGLKA
jgi:succinylglutamic semialdehyde dehydrogenase